jgi:hypothetical protein
MASPAESSTSARFANPTEGKEEGINELLKRLGFEEDEVDDLIFEEESDVPLDGIKWGWHSPGYTLRITSVYKRSSSI